MEDGARGDRQPARVHASRGAPTTSRVGQPPLDVVVVSYRSRELTRTCLESIREYVGLDNVRLFVVDNASRDGTVEMIRGEYPHITLICNEENVGFARANNLA